MKNHVCVLIILFVPALNAQGQAIFQGLGDFPGGAFHSSASDLAADGSIVVGAGETEIDGQFRRLPFRWTSATGLVSIEVPPGPWAAVASATDISPSGAVIIGSLSGERAFRWTVAEGAVLLPSIDPPEGYIPSDSATGVSEGGGVIVGSQLLVELEGDPTVFTRAIRWTEAGPEVLVPAPGESGHHTASGVSDMGLVATGALGGRAFQWTQATGMVPIGPDLLSAGHCVSGDGRVIGGTFSQSPFSRPAFRWAEGTGMRSIGRLLTSGSTIAFASSHDGSVLVGYSGNSAESQAFIWDRRRGMRSLHDVLKGFDLDVGDWSLRRATGVSADGSHICGYGINPDGNTEAFLITLPPFCLADWNDDGSVRSADIVAFLGAWFSELSGDGWATDLNDSGSVTAADITAFLGAWFAALAEGC